MTLNRSQKNIAAAAGAIVLLLGAFIILPLLCPRKDALKKPEKITCVKNLKQIGLSMRIWSADHGDEYPFNVSTNNGGTREWCLADASGFDTNTWLHLMILSNEFNTPVILVCPQDQGRKTATNFSSLRAEHVTYRLRSGAEVNETNAQAVLAVCPVDGNTVYCDGTVVEGKDLRGKH